MLATQNNSFSTHFQQIFAFFCVLMTDSCILLFFRNLASKSQNLLITNDLYFCSPLQIGEGLGVRFSQPNRAKNFFLWRYSDTKITFVLNLVRQTDKPFQTRRAVTSRRRYAPDCRDVDLSRPIGLCAVKPCFSFSLPLCVKLLLLSEMLPISAEKPPPPHRVAVAWGNKTY
jgi:hypothetical protein